MKPIILYENILRDGTLTASSTNAGSDYDIENIIDYRSYTLWKSAGVDSVTISLELSSAAAADSIGIYNHNLGTGGASIKVQYKEDDAWQTAHSFDASKDKSILETFDSVSSSNWRIIISGVTAVPYIGIIYLGSILEFPWPPSTPVEPAEESINIEGSYSKAGNFLGGLLTYNPISITHKFELISRTWYDTYFKPFWNNHGKLLKPFFYSVDLENNPEDTFWLHFDPDFTKSNPYSLKKYYDSFSLQLIGVSEE